VWGSDLSGTSGKGSFWNKYSRIPFTGNWQGQKIKIGKVGEITKSQVLAGIWGYFPKEHFFTMKLQQI
jgi:hypothetical protein